jgi:hypothetical protein
MSVENPDLPPPKDEKEEEEEEEKPPVEKFSYYLKPYVSYKIVSTKWVTFTCLGGFTYFYHFAWTVAGVDNFCDYTRLLSCNADLNGDDASAVYDLAIGMVTVFHMVEWLRQTVFLTTALVNVNLMPLYYLLSLNVPYGFIAMIVGIGARYGADGAACAEAQELRSQYLRDQIFALILYIFMCWAHIIFFYIKGVDWCHEQWLAEDDDEDD